jgi:predicted amidohydrolase
MTPDRDSVIPFRLAMAQMRVEWGAADRNVGRAAKFIGEAAAQGCSVVVLPECLDVGWTHPDAAALALPIPGSRSDALGRAARQHGVWVVAGLTERDGPLTYNAAVLLSPEGEVVLKHRKINVLDIALSCYAIGDRLGVAPTPFGTVGVDICADNFPSCPALATALGRMGARMILSPCAWAVDADHDNEREPYGAMWRESYGRIARLFDVPVVGVSNVGRIEGGPWQGRKCIGCSLAVGRGGEVLATGPYGDDAEAVVPVELEVTPAPASGTALSAWMRDRVGNG